jgi:hypothetical protein
VEFVHGEVDNRDDAQRAPDDDETGREPLPMAVGRAERRLQVRAYSLWTSLLGDRRFPSLSAFDLDALSDLAPYGVLIDFSAARADPAIGRIGTALVEECGPPGTIARLSDAPAGSLLSRIADHYREILTRQAPVGFEAEFVNWRGATVLYRGILLPFSSDDATIDHVFGVINWKELADAQVCEQLQFEIADAIEPLRRLQLQSEPSSEWSNDPSEPARDLDVDVADSLRRRDPVPLSALPQNGGEFMLVLARRQPDGAGITLLGEVAHDPRLLQHAARRLLD